MSVSITVRSLTLIVLVLLACAVIFPQTTSFTYQGELTDNSQPANGSYDFEFALFDSLDAGSQVGSTITRTAVQVTDGRFSVTLDFGDQFPGAGRWLEVRVRLTGQPGITTLGPRQVLQSAPYSVRSLAANVATNALAATTADNALQLGGVAAGQYVATTDPRMTDARPPTAGSGDYIQNTTTQQASSDFSISGTGKADKFDAVSQYDIAGNRVLSNAGTSNLFLGNDAGRDNTGNDNTFAGWSAGVQNTTGSHNAYFGANAGLYSNGVSNSFFGSWAGYLNVGGNGNSFFGREAGYNNTGGSRNTFFGRNAGRSNIAGTSNSAFGYGADLGLEDLTFATAIGSNAVVSTSNTVQLGRADGSDAVFIPGALNVVGAIAGDLTGNATTATNALSLGGVAADQYLTTAAGNANYIRNTISPQTGSNFNISGTGTAAIFSAGTQYNIGSIRVMHTFGTGNFFAGQNAGNSTMVGSYNTANGFNALVSNTTGLSNTANGWRTLWSNTEGSFNTASGSAALANNSIGSSNTANGFNALYGNTTGSLNTASGYRALFSNTTGWYNTATGDSALLSNGPGYSNTANGNSALYSNTAGDYNTASGAGALYYNTTGNENTANGSAALFSNTAGKENTANGFRALYNTTTGYSNTASGYSALYSNTTGSFNTAIGYGANVGTSALSFATAIGALTVVTSSNTVQLGRDGSDVVRIGKLGAAGSTSLCQNTSKELAVCSSSIRYKSNIENLTSGFDLIRRLRPVSFNWKDSGALDLGLVAEEMAEIEPLLVTYNSDGLVEGVKYDRLGVVLVNVVKEQQKTIDRQKEQLDAQNVQIKALKEAVCSMNKQLKICN